MREHLTFRPDTPLRAAIISDAFATLSMGSDMESLFGNPNYPQQVAERIGWDMQSGQVSPATVSRVVLGLAGEIIALTQRHRYPSTKLMKLTAELALLTGEC